MSRYDRAEWTRMVEHKPLERDELRACLEYLQTHPLVAWAVRMNVGAMRDEERFVQFGFTGCSDILGMLKGGRFLAFEVKRKGKKPTDDQAAFLKKVAEGGGLAWYGTIDDCILMMTRLT